VSLRARLTLFFVAIVVLPVTALSAFGWRTAARVGERQVRSELELARRSAMLALSAQAERARDAVAAVSRDPALTRALAAGDADAVQALLDRHGATSLLVAVTAPTGGCWAGPGAPGPASCPASAGPRSGGCWSRSRGWGSGAGRSCSGSPPTCAAAAAGRPTRGPAGWAG
jgi:hypothetical protein